MTTDGYMPKALAVLTEAIEKEERFREKNAADVAADNPPSESKLRMQQKLLDKKLDEAVALEAAAVTA